MAADATIVVKFGDGSDASEFAVINLDESRNKNSKGEVITSFTVSDQIYFYVHLLPGYRVTNITKTSGTLSNLGGQSFTTKEQVYFEELNTKKELSHYPNGNNISPVWYGNTGDFSRTGRELTNRFNGPCIGDITYDFNAFLFRFTPQNVVIPEDEQFPVLIVIYIG
jgi:hypothetical protein